MNNIFLVLLACMALTLNVSAAQARDTGHFFLIEEALESPGAEEALALDVELHFSGETEVDFKEDLGTFVTNRKTSSAFKSDKLACEWGMLSALKTLQERAVKEGGNAVVDIHSYYDKVPHKSDGEYECHAGAIIAGVALRGTVVKR